MKKLMAVWAVFSLCAGGVSALEDAPAGSERLLLYGHPRFVSGANSAAGGPLFETGSYSPSANPALTAGIQCLSADLGYAGILRADGSENGLGSAARLGLSVPTRWGVMSFAAQGLFLEKGLGLGNMALGRVGFSRDITENFYLGLSATGGGFFYGDNNDFFVAADAGAWYRVPRALFFRQLRFGVAFQNLGKTFQTYGSGTTNKPNTIYPGIITPKAGVAAHLLESKNIDLGLSADVLFPVFSNFALYAGVQARIAGLITVSAGWDFNAREAADGAGLHKPYVGIGARFQLNTSNSELLKKRGFNQTEIDADVAGQALHRDTYLFSAGATARFGVRDTIPPDIKVGDIRYE